VQLATVGTHWPLSRAFNKEEIDNFLRAGSCVACHQNMSDEKLWQKVSTDGKLDTKKHIKMLAKMLKVMSEKAEKGKDW